MLVLSKKEREEAIRMYLENQRLSEQIEMWKVVKEI
jgi:hypothetical protein